MFLVFPMSSMHLLRIADCCWQSKPPLAKWLGGLLVAHSGHSVQEGSLNILQRSSAAGKEFPVPSTTQVHLVNSLLGQASIPLLVIASGWYTVLGV